MLSKQRVVLIEDEPLARDELKHILERKHLDVEVIGEAENSKDGWELIEKCEVDGIFLDINLETGSRREGMDLAYVINNLPKPPWIVFTTAYAEYGAEAFDVNATHFLLKPLDDAKVAKALERIVGKLHPPIPASLPSTIEISHHLTNHNGESHLTVEYVEPQKEILYVRTEPNSDRVRVHLKGCRDLHGVRGPLEDWQDRLAPYEFVDIHKGYLVNRAFRGCLKRHPFRDAYQLSLKGGCPDLLPVRRFFQWGGR